MVHLKGICVEISLWKVYRNLKRKIIRYVNFQVVFSTWNLESWMVESFAWSIGQEGSLQQVEITYLYTGSKIGAVQCT
jgi:hypothetical protein